MPLADGQAASSQAAARRSPPAVVEARTIGHTVKGRGIVAWRLGQPTAERKVVVLGGHARQRDRTVAHPLQPARRPPIRGADIWVIPQYNRDGIVRRTRQNAHGVDLNRNYPRNWKRHGRCHQLRTAPGLGAGDQGGDGVPAQDPAALRRQLPPAAATASAAPARKGAPFVRRLHRGLHLPVKSFNCSGVCHGTMTEWFNANFPGVAVTVEYGRGVSRKQATRTGPTGLLRAVGARR